MKAIPLTQNKVALVDDEDFNWLSSWRWHWMSPNRAARKKPRRFGPLRTSYMHHALLRCPEGCEVDHIDGNGLNNQKANLRVCVHAENLRNNRIRKDNRSGAKGVDFMKRKGKWRVRVGAKHLGLFPTFEEAVLAYNAQAAIQFGTFARLNSL